ncbi:MAG: DMT family transporter [Desulfocurvibacter africanus]
MASTSTATALELKARQEFSFARRGLFWALASGMCWGLDGVVLGVVLASELFQDGTLWLLAPLSVAALHDTFASLWLLLSNMLTGRFRELRRTIRSKPVRQVALGAIFGGPLGMSAYLLGLKMAGSAYVLPITSLYPAVASVLAAFFLKERVCLRAWIGLLICIGGGIIIGWTPPTETLGSDFYIGIALALVATVGWGAEGVLAASAMDLLDPAVALNIRQGISSLIYLLLILPLAGGWSLIIPTLGQLPGWLTILAAAVGAFSYLCWYRAMNMTGVSRAMALNITYSLWGIVFSALLLGTEITSSLVWGALAIVVGMVLVIGNPMKMTSLRNVQ